jgi:hypothetical protein
MDPMWWKMTEPSPMFPLISTQIGKREAGRLQVFKHFKNPKNSNGSREIAMPSQILYFNQSCLLGKY